MRTCFGFVTYYHGNYDWTRVCVSSFRKVFGDSMPLFVVDHNHNPDERAFLARQGVAVLENDTGRELHGIGLDVLAQYARGQGYDVLVVIEPDCLISGDGWFKNLMAAIGEGFHMAGTCVLNFGPIHPVGSAWLLDSISGTFVETAKGDEMLSLDYDRLIDTAEITPGLPHFVIWDVGLKNWFSLARVGLAKAVPDDGFRHFWRGRYRSPIALTKLRPETRKLLTPWLINVM